MNARDLVYIPLAIATAPLWARKGRAGWRERFGRIERLADPAAGRPRLLIHAVSVGEVSALRGLVPRLVEDGIDVVVSVTTDTGTARARALFPGVRVVRYPLDFSWSVERFLGAVRPTAVALVELEVWPNFVGACRRRGVAVCVINGRLSERSFRGYRRIRGALRGTFASLAWAGVQDEVYARRFEAMGVFPADCLVTGSMKWDAVSVGATEADAALASEIAGSMGIDRGRPLVVAGSTGPGEEALIHEACVRAFPGGVQLLCAPRKPERFEEAAAALVGCVRRSRVRGVGGGEGMSGAAGGGAIASASGSGGVGGGGHRRYLLDTIGELRAAYTLADVVVMGRSFVRLYGSDPIEPVSLGKATVIGPRVGDFESVVRALEGAGGLVRADAAGLAEVLASLMGDAERRAEVARRGLACIESQRGATARHAALLGSMLARGRSGAGG